MKNNVKIWVQRDPENENQAGFAVTITCDLGAGSLRSQKYQAEL